MTMISTLLLYLAILLPIGYVIYLVSTSHVVRAVFLRNVMSYFSGILGYLFIVVFVVVAAILAFNSEFFTANLANLDQLTESFPLLLLFIVPAITMTVWAEERKQGTDELLFTLPSSDTEILIGKYLSVVAVYSVALLFSTGLWAVLEAYSDPGWRMFVSTYLGYWLAGSSLLAVGMFASSLTRSATVAFVLGGIFCSVPVFLTSSTLKVSADFLNETLGLGVTAGLWEPLTAFSVGEHLHEFSLGVVRLSSLLYFESLAVLFLYLNLVVISERHWSRTQKWQMGIQYAFRAVSVLAVLVSLYVVVTQSSGRADIDLTPQRYFTLSDATVESLDNIESDRPVTIQAFLSPDVPTDYVRTKRRLQGLLRQIDQRGGGRVDVRMIETEIYQPAADEAKSFGIEPREVAVEEGGKFVTEDVYMGLVVSSSYDEVVVPFLGRGIPVEYELTRALRTVSNAHRLSVGVLETEANVMSNPQTQEILDELRKQYDVVSVSADNPIQREKQVFEIEESLVRKLKKTEQTELPEGVRKLFDEENHPLSEEVRLNYDEETETWTLRDLKAHRKYEIHLVEAETEDDSQAENQSENAEVDSEETQAGDNADDKEAEDDEKKTEEESEPQYAVFMDRYDALIAILPSTLTQTQMGNFVDYVEGGGPTLIFDDPLPVSLQPPHGPPGLAPRLNVQPSSPMGGEPRADGGRATSLLNVLNLEWDNGEVAWDLYNPFTEYEDRWVQGLYTVVGQRKNVPEAVNDENAVTQGLGRMLLLYSGHIREKTPDKLEFTPLMKSSENLSGVFSWDEIVRTQVFRNPDPRTRRPMPVEYFQILPVEDTLPPINMEGMSEEEKKRSIQGTRFRPNSRSQVFAARIRGKADNNVNAIYVADADMISDVFFEIRRDNAMDLNLDNVSFVLNAIDVLAGEEAFLELRRRKPPQPSLTEIEKEKQELRAAQRAAVNEARAAILERQKKLRKVLDDLNKEINSYEEQSISQTMQKVREASMTLQAEKRRLDKEQEKLTDELNKRIEEAKVEYERGVQRKENAIRRKAVVLPALPAIAMGLIFLAVRLINERREIAPNRRR